MTKKYAHIKIPVELAKEVDEVLKEHGYTSRAEFVKHAIRSLLEMYGVYAEQARSHKSFNPGQ